MAWSVTTDTSQAVVQMQRISDGIAHARPMNAAIVLRMQDRARANWPSDLHAGGPLQWSICGTGGGISTAPGTLNSATDGGASIGSDLPYAEIQLHGGTVRATNVKYLAIPLTAAAQAAGSPLHFGRPLALIPLKDGSGYLMVDGEEVTITRGKNRGSTRIAPAGEGSGRGIIGQRATAQFALKEAVKELPHPYMPSDDEADQIAQEEGDRYMQALCDGTTTDNAGRG